MTDHHVVIPLKVTDTKSLEGDIQITTELVDTPRGYTRCHHDHYFKEMWLNEKGVPDKGNVFLSEGDAIDYATKKAEADVSEYQKKILNLTNIISDLKENKESLQNVVKFTSLPSNIQAAQASSEALNADIECVREDILSTYTEEELTPLADFDAFFSLIDVTNSFEEGWDENKDELRPFYNTVWDEFKSGKLVFDC